MLGLTLPNNPFCPRRRECHRTLTLVRDHPFCTRSYRNAPVRRHRESIGDTPTTFIIARDHVSQPPAVRYPRRSLRSLPSNPRWPGATGLYIRSLPMSPRTLTAYDSLLLRPGSRSEGEGVRARVNGSAPNRRLLVLYSCVALSYTPGRSRTRSGIFVFSPTLRLKYNLVQRTSGGLKDPLDSALP